MDIVLINNQVRGAVNQGGTAVYTDALLKHLKKNGVQSTLIDSETYTSDIKFILKLMVSRKPKGKIIHAQLPIYAIPYLFRKRNKIVITLHGDNVKAIFRKRGKFIGKLFQKAESFALKRADALISVDAGTEKVYREYFPELEMHTIPVGVNLDTFKLLDKTDMRKRHGLDGFIILYVGRLREDKGVGMLIEAFNLVKKELPEARLIIVGEGKDSDKLKNIASKDVKFLGPVPYDKMPEIMNCADVFSLASLYESGPLVIMEALACGVPCVTTDVGRVGEFIKSDECGRIVERTPITIANAILELRKNHGSREECRKSVEGLGFSNTGERTIKIYNTLINK